MVAYFEGFGSRLKKNIGNRRTEIIVKTRRDCSMEFPQQLQNDACRP